jgi:peptidyl-prolyl cis-trans isomerase C
MNKPLFPEVRVGGVAIPSAAIAAEAQNHPAPKGKPGLAWKAAARSLVLRHLMLQDAASRGLEAEPAEVAPGRFETDEEALLRAYLDTVVEIAPPSAEEVRAIWLAEPGKFLSHPLWSASHILFSGKDAQARAIAAAEKLLENPSTFAAIARHESDCPSRERGGDLGQLSPGATVPEFEAVLRSLEPGEITGAPVQTRFGWHLIRLDALAPGRPLPFDAVAPRISEALEKKAWVEAMHRLAEDLLSNSEVTGIEMTAGEEA